VLLKETGTNGFLKKSSNPVAAIFFVFEKIAAIRVVRRRFEKVAAIRVVRRRFEKVAAIRVVRRRG